MSINDSSVLTKLETSGLIFVAAQAVFQLIGIFLTLKFTLPELASLRKMKMQNSKRISLQKCLQPESSYVRMYVMSVCVCCVHASVCLSKCHLQQRRTAGVYSVCVCTFAHKCVFVSMRVLCPRVCNELALPERCIQMSPVEQSWQEVWFLHFFWTQLTSSSGKQLLNSLSLLASSHTHFSPPKQTCTCTQTAHFD